MTSLSKVVSLETAKRLKENGFPQDTERMYLMIPHVENKRFVKHGELLDSTTTSLRRYEVLIPDEDKIAAPDAQELLDWIHEQIRTCGNHIEFSVDWYVDGWEVNVRNSGSGEREKFVDKNLSEAITQAALYTIMRYKKLL
jgi:hypothetical protein